MLCELPSHFDRVKRKRRSSSVGTHAKRNEQPGNGLGCAVDESTSDTAAKEPELCGEEAAFRHGIESSGWLSARDPSQELVSMSGCFPGEGVNSQYPAPLGESLISASEQWLQYDKPTPHGHTSNPSTPTATGMGFSGVLPASGTGNGCSHSLPGSLQGSPVLFDSEKRDVRTGDDDELTAGICDGDLHTSLDSSFLKTLVAEATSELGDYSSSCAPLPASYVSSQEDIDVPALPGPPPEPLVPQQAVREESGSSAMQITTGTFFGLPEKVPSLLRSQRGITKLYGKVCQYLMLYLLVYCFLQMCVVGGGGGALQTFLCLILVL